MEAQCSISGIQEEALKKPRELTMLFLRFPRCLRLSAFFFIDFSIFLCLFVVLHLQCFCCKRTELGGIEALHLGRTRNLVKLWMVRSP